MTTVKDTKIGILAWIVQGAQCNHRILRGGSRRQKIRLMRCEKDSTSLSGFEVAGRELT